jgi:hypothetical protein
MGRKVYSAGVLAADRTPTTREKARVGDGPDSTALQSIVKPSEQDRELAARWIRRRHEEPDELLAMLGLSRPGAS